MNAIYVLLITILMTICSFSKKTIYTQVTFLYDIKRGQIKKDRLNRSFAYYLSHFEKQLKTDCNMIIFGQKQLGQLVWKRRSEHNTIFIERTITSFRNYWFQPLIHKYWNNTDRAVGVEDKEKFLQYRYNYDLLMMGKIQIMFQSLKYDKFNSDILIWTDGGHTHTYSQKMSVFSPQNIFRKFYQLVQPQWVFYCYPWNSNVIRTYSEGWQMKYEINRKVKFRQMVIATTHGGSIQLVKDLKSAFENLLKATLQNGDLDSDQSIDSMMPIRFPYLIPTTTTLFTKDLMNKINVNEEVNRKPSHSRWFGCQFNANSLMINYDFPISRDNILGDITNTSVDITRMSVLYQAETTNIEQIPMKDIAILESQYGISERLRTSKNYFWLHIIIIAILGFSYIKIQQMKKSFRQNDQTCLKSYKLSDRSQQNVKFLFQNYFDHS